LIAAGTRLGPYEVAAQLGAGGMGEVYRPRDSRLDRTVAIKVLPARLSSDARLRERFEREAKAISSLTHPHICTPYDVGSHDGVDYLVMEFLEGESLADRLAKGALPLEQVLRYGVEIAEALERAHRAGIVHRDLTPGNVMLTKSGAKLLDFDLAKFAQPAANDPNALTAAMTHAKPLTEEGAIVGTFQYMAPEQIEGRDADARTDIFALGSLLYEMTTGKRAFEAKSRASLIASILDREPPPISTVQPLAPLSLERVIRTCLAKDPDERWQSAHDVATQLRWIRDASAETPAPVPRRARVSRAMAIAATALVALAAGAVATWLALRDRTPPRPVARFTINTLPSAPMSVGPGAFAISPDGARIVYRAAPGALYVRGAADPTPRALGVSGEFPAFSPDGHSLAYVDAGVAGARRRRRRRPLLVRRLDLLPGRFHRRHVARAERWRHAGARRAARCEARLPRHRLAAMPAGQRDHRGDGVDRPIVGRGEDRGDLGARAGGRTARRRHDGLVLAYRTSAVRARHDAAGAAVRREVAPAHRQRRHGRHRHRDEPGERRGEVRGRCERRSALRAGRPARRRAPIAARIARRHGDAGRTDAASV
jgi:predicted Ser/Thr protein kinase